MGDLQAYFGCSLPCTIHCTCFEGICVAKATGKKPTLGQRHYSYWSKWLDEPGQEYVYVIRAGMNNPVKIGVAKKPLTRLKTLQTANAQTLRLLLVVPGGKVLERVLHQRFAEWRMNEHSEWFYGPGVAKIVEFVTALSVEMVQAHHAGDWEAPDLAGFPGWTDEERNRFRPPLPTIPMCPPRTEPVDVDPLTITEYDFVPTIRARVRRSSVGALCSNRGHGPLTQ